MLEFNEESKCLFTPLEFKEKSGYNLTARLKTDDEENVEIRFLNYASDMVYNAFLEFNSFDENKVAYIYKKNTKQIALAQYYQAVYLFENGDLSATNGMDQNNLLSLEEIRNMRKLAPNVVIILMKYSHTGVM